QFSQTDEQPPPGRGHVTDRARAAQRANATAYQQQRGPQVAENALIYGYVDQTPRAPKRAPASAYWIDGSTLILGADAPAAFGHVTQRAPAAQRAGQAAYVAAVSPPAVAEPTVFGFQSQP